MKEFYDPLLNQFFGNPKLKEFEGKETIKESFDDATKLANQGLAKLGHKEESNTGAFHRLTNSLNLKKVLVGSHNRKPFYALVDFKERVCLPYIEKDTQQPEAKE